MYRDPRRSPQGWAQAKHDGHKAQNMRPSQRPQYGGHGDSGHWQDPMSASFAMNGAPQNALMGRQEASITPASRDTRFTQAQPTYGGQPSRGAPPPAPPLPGAGQEPDQQMRIQQLLNRFRLPPNPLAGR